MRYLHAIPHPHLRLSLYSWNGKYILKAEAGPYEQTYKVSEMDVASPEEVATLLDATFLAAVEARFSAMDADWTATLARHEFSD